MNAVAHTPDPLAWVDGHLGAMRLVTQERARQVARYGLNRDLADGTGPDACWAEPVIDVAQSAYSGGFDNTDVQKILRGDYEHHEHQHGAPTWMHLVREEVAEAFQESDPERLEEELVQVAALCVSWIETLHSRKGAVNG